MRSPPAKKVQPDAALAKAILFKGIAVAVQREIDPRAVEIVRVDSYPAIAVTDISHLIFCSHLHQGDPACRFRVVEQYAEVIR